MNGGLQLPQLPPSPSLYPLLPEWGFTENLVALLTQNGVVLEPSTWFKVIGKLSLTINIENPSSRSKKTDARNATPINRIPIRDTPARHNSKYSHARAHHS